MPACLPAFKRKRTMDMRSVTLPSREMLGGCGVLRMAAAAAAAARGGCFFPKKKIEGLKGVQVSRRRSPHLQLSVEFKCDGVMMRSSAAAVEARPIRAPVVGFGWE